jgi:hypothetical protein
MTATAVDRVPAIADAGVVGDEQLGRPDPEVPERARRRTFTAKYKQQILAAYETADPARPAPPPACRRPAGTAVTVPARPRPARTRPEIAAVPCPRVGIVLAALTRCCSST